MTLTSSGIASLRQLRHWFRRRVLQERSWMDGSPYSHEKMLMDKNRCDVYQDAIQRTVKPGDVVVDLGAGTGLLSFFAVQAGARHVYAIELSAIADVAAELIEANGFRDRITLIRENSNKVRLPERCNVLVTETLSSFCFDEENIIEAIADARERFLKPKGRIIPQLADTFLVPFSSDSFGVGRLLAIDGQIGRASMISITGPWLRNSLSNVATCVLRANHYWLLANLHGAINFRRTRKIRERPSSRFASATTGASTVSSAGSRLFSARPSHLAIHHFCQLPTGGNSISP